MVVVTQGVKMILESFQKVRCEMLCEVQEWTCITDYGYCHRLHAFHALLPGNASNQQPS
jgi:hypothetical protein